MAEVQELNYFLRDLQIISGPESDAQQAAEQARDQIAQYLHVAPQPRQPLIFRQLGSYEADVELLLSLKLRV